MTTGSVQDPRESSGWLALLGGGEFSFGETAEADSAWLAKVGEGAVGFVPTASGSVDYAQHFATYLDESFDRASEVIPVYRPRDARRQKNVARIEAAPAVYLGGGVADDLLATLGDSPVLEALGRRRRSGGVVVAIAAAAQAAGVVTRGLRGGTLPGFGWLPGTAIEANFTPAHDRRLRELLEAGPEVGLGIGLAAGSALLCGADGSIEIVGTVFKIEGADGDVEPITEATQLWS